MSQRNRTIQWCEGRILEVLGKTRKGKEPTSLALSAMVMKYEIRSIEDQHNWDIAVVNLLSRQQIIQIKNKDGFTVYKFVA